MKRFLAVGISTLAVLVVSQNAMAQEDVIETEDESQETGAVEGPESAGLGTIMVTAQRREENLQDAALAVTVADADQLVRAGVTDTTQLTQVAPSLQVGTIAGSANTFYLRGVGNFTTNSASDAAVSFNVDGVPYARSQAAHAVFYDLERVEVLKGPQGILYGRNSTGGAINVITRRPRLGMLEGYVSGEYGNFDAYKATAAINLPVSDSMAVRLTGYLADHEGYYTDGTGDDETQAVRAQFAAEIGGTIDLLVGADYSHQGGVGPGATLVGLDFDERIGLFDPRADARYQSAYAFLAGNFMHPLPNEQFPPFNDNEFWGVFAQLDVETPIGTLTVLPAFRQTLLDQRSYAPSFSYNSEMDSKQTSLEIRLASDSGNFLDYLVGVFYMNEDTLEMPLYNQAYFAGDIIYDLSTKSYAGFGQLTFNLSDRLRVNAGARYTIDDKEGSIDTLGLAVVCPASFAGGNCLGTPAIRDDQIPGVAFTAGGVRIPVQPWGTSGAILSTTLNNIDAAETFKKPTFRLGAEYDAAEESLLYATVETGFKSGGFFSTIDDPVYDLETITAFTIGSKNRFLDDRVQLNLEGFYWIYKDQQVSHLSTNRLGGVEFVTENIGQTDIWGVDVDAQFRVTRGTTVFANVQYLNAEYTDFVYFNPVGTGVPTSGCNITGPANGAFKVDCTGRTAPNSPEWTLSGGLEQILPVGDDDVVFNLDARYQSGIFTGFEQLPTQYQDGYAVINAQLAYEMHDPALSLAVFVNNLTDTNAMSFTLPNPRAGPALVVASLRPPRTYGVRVRFGF